MKAIASRILLAAFALFAFAHFDVRTAKADSFGSGADAFDIEFVSVGSPGNAADTTGNPNPAGSVPYTYRIGKYEISEQMINKANTLGGLSISQGSHGPDKPATAVSWNQAARFVNWLNTSRGFPAAYKFKTQPGDLNYSLVENISLWVSGDAGFNAANPFRNSLARYFLPSIDEWYKAAYYDPSSGIYYDYATGSDTVPTSVAGGTTAGTAVYLQASNAFPADITQAGGLSPYGTMAQGGNAHEWEETEFDLANSAGGSSRGFRGGNWGSASDLLSSSFRLPGGTNSMLGSVGFRVASTPEPESLTLSVAGLLAIILWRGKMQQR